MYVCIYAYFYLFIQFSLKLAHQRAFRCPVHMSRWGERKGFSIITEFMAGRKDPVYRELLALKRIRFHGEPSFFLFCSFTSPFSSLFFSLFLSSTQRRFYVSLRPSENAYATLYDRRA